MGSESSDRTRAHRRRWQTGAGVHFLHPERQSSKSASGKSFRRLEILPAGRERLVTASLHSRFSKDTVDAADS